MNIEKTLDALKKAQANPLTASLTKAWSVGSGLVNYDLQAPALALYPWGEMLTPLRNEITRVKGDGDTATRWKVITGINTTKLPVGLSEGNRGGVLTSTLANYTAAYVGLGIEDNVTFEADYASEGFDDVRARAVEGTLRSLMISEEKMIFGGNSSIALGTTPTPSLSQATTGGALSDGTFKVVCVALSHDGWDRATVAAGVVQTIVRTNADATSDTINGGTAQQSAIASITVNGGGTTQVVKATVTAVKGAVAYAWYIGPDDTHQYLAAITTINSYVFTATPANTFQNAASLTAADYSKDNTYSFDGLLYQTGFAAAGAYFVQMATGVAGTGTPLTSDGAGGIVEINTMLKSFYDNYRLSPDTLWCNSQEIVNISNKVIAGGAAPLFRFNMDAKTENLSIVAGAVVGSYLNKITGQLVRVRVHPFAPPGTILASSKTLPYPQSGVTTVAEMKTRREYYQVEWPLKTRKYEYGCYVDETLAVRFIPAFGVITNIANG